MGLFDFFRKKQPPASSLQNRPSNLQPAIDGNSIVEQLDQLGYFRFADPADIPELKKEIAERLRKDNYLSTIYEDKRPYNSKDYRNYGLDGETVFEEGGFISALEDMQVLFDKLNFKLIINHHLEEWVPEHKWINHRITINGKEYIIFDKYTGAYEGWGIAPMMFAEILNDQFSLQGISEKIYLANSGNDGRLMVMTEEQYKVIDPVLERDYERPYDIEQWCKVMKVPYENY